MRIKPNPTLTDAELTAWLRDHHDRAEDRLATVNARVAQLEAELADLHAQQARIRAALAA